VSAKTRVGLDELLEIILLVADLQELKANPEAGRRGTVIEARLDKGRGPVATIIVQTGTLRVGDVVVAGNTYGKVKALESPAASGRRRPAPPLPLSSSASPTRPRPATCCASSRTRRPPAGWSRHGKNEQAAAAGGSSRATLEDLYRQIQAGQAKELRMILKADVSGRSVRSRTPWSS